MPTAILFPGQGSQTPEMRDMVAEVRPDLLELAIEVVGEDPFLRADDDTRYAQPAILAASLAGWSTMRADLAEGLTAPVRWRETVLNLQDAGIDRFVDVGPGKVLAKLVKRIARSAELVHA